VNLNSIILDELLEQNAKLKYKEWEATFAGYDKTGVIKVKLNLHPGNTLPKLYDKGTWTFYSTDKQYTFLGEIKERYGQGNECMVDIRLVNGLFEKDNPPIMCFDKDREAIIITGSSEKLVVNIYKFDPNHAVIESPSELPKNERVWLRYKDLAIASLPNLEHNREGGKFIYCLDFSVETLEKRGKIAEMILKDRL